ncbi:MAG: hypothetical protein AAGK74_03835 [Chloroflexota bacterium]
MSLKSDFRTLLTILPVVLAAMLGGLQLNRDALWYDEVISYYLIGAAQYEPLLPPAAFLERLVLVDRWPPVYYALLTPWSIAAGFTPFSGRVLSWFAGLLTVAAAARLGMDVAPPSLKRGGGALSALVLASSAFFIYFLHELRGYTVYPLLTTLSFLFYWRVLHKVTRWRAAGFVLFTLLALYSHLATYPMVAAIGLYHLVWGRRIKREAWVRVTVLIALVGVLTLPWLVVIYFKLGQGQTIGQTSPWLPLLAFLPSFGNRVWPLLVLALVAAGWRARTSGTGYAAALVILTMAITLALNVAAPFLFHMRHLVGILPVFYVIVGVGAAAMLARYRLITGVLLAVWVVAGIWNSFDFRYMLATPGHEPTLPTAAMDTLIHTAEHCIAEDDVAILYIGEIESRGLPWEWINDVVMVYYWREVPFRFAHINTLDPITNDDPMGEDPQTPITDIADYVPKATRFVADAERVWLLRLNHLPEIEQQMLLIETLAAEGYTEAVQHMDTPHITGWVYYSDQAAPEPCLPDERT